MRSGPRARLAILSFALACAGGDRYVPEPWESARPRPLPAGQAEPESFPTPPDCLYHPQARAYTARLRHRLYEGWTLPSSPMEGERITLRFRLDASGAVTWSEVASPDTPVARSALEALRRASPFGAIPTEVGCLAGMPFVATFQVMAPQ